MTLSILFYIELDFFFFLFWIGIEIDKFSRARSSNQFVIKLIVILVVTNMKLLKENMRTRMGNL